MGSSIKQVQQSQYLALQKSSCFLLASHNYLPRSDNGRSVVVCFALCKSNIQNRGRRPKRSNQYKSTQQGLMLAGASADLLLEQGDKIIFYHVAALAALRRRRALSQPEFETTPRTCVARLSVMALASMWL